MTKDVGMQFNNSDAQMKQIKWRNMERNRERKRLRYIAAKIKIGVETFCGRTREQGETQREEERYLESRHHHIQQKRS